MSFNNLLLAKGNGTFTVSNIPSAGAKSAVLTFISNHKKTGEYSISSTTSNITIEEPNIEGDSAPFNITIKIRIPTGTEKFDLTFKNTNKNVNVRIDDIKLVGTVSGGGGTTPGEGSGSEGEQAESSEPHASVSTDATTYIGNISATLKGSFSEAVSKPSKVGFKYGTERENLNQEKLLSEIPSGPSGSFSVSISDLISEKTYYYQAFVEIKGTGKHLGESKIFEGEVKEFKTLKELPAGNSDEPALAHTWLELPAKSESMQGSDYYYNTHHADFLGKNQRNFSYLYDAKTYTSYWVSYPLYADNLGGERKDKWGPKDDKVPEEKQVKISSSYGIHNEKTTKEAIRSLLRTGGTTPNSLCSVNATFRQM